MCLSDKVVASTFNVKNKPCSNRAQGIARSGITARAVTSTPHHYSRLSR